MVQTILKLDSNLQNFVNIFKAQRNLKNKNEAIAKIIEEYRELKKEEFEDKILAFECSLASEKSLSENWLSKEDEEAFDYLQK